MENDGIGWKQSPLRLSDIDAGNYTEAGVRALVEERDFLAAGMVGLQALSERLFSPDGLPQPAHPKTIADSMRMARRKMARLEVSVTILELQHHSATECLRRVDAALRLARSMSTGAPAWMRSLIFSGALWGIRRAVKKSKQPIKGGDLK